MYKVWDDYSNIFGSSNFLECLRYIKPLNDSHISSNYLWVAFLHLHVVFIIIHCAVFGDNPVTF